MIKFKFFFFKESNRNYDLSELLKYLQDHKAMTMVTRSDCQKQAVYKDPDFGYEASFYVSENSMCPNLEKLNPKYLDVNIRVEFDCTLPTAFVKDIINICYDLCSIFNFYIYSELYEDVCECKKNQMLKAFQVVKSAYKKKYAVDFVDIYKVSEDMFEQAYNYKKLRKNIEQAFVKDDVVIPEIKYYKTSGTRCCYTAIVLKETKNTVIPSFVDILCFAGKKHIYISMKELFDKCKRSFDEIIGGSIKNLFYLTQKELKKIYKLALDNKFTRNSVELNEIDFKFVLDI